MEGWIQMDGRMGVEIKKGLSYLRKNYKENDLKGKIIYFKLAGGLSY